MMRDPRINPRPGDGLARIQISRAGVSSVLSRRVLALEHRFPAGIVVVWTRKRSNRPCRCTLRERRAWAKKASMVPL